MRNGFTLVELAIVLVILGLLTGGILAGQSLIRAAEIRSIGADYQRYQGATYAFRDKYLALPGDMPNATSFWKRADTGAVGGTCADSVNNKGLGTCNGNGNGYISDLVWEQFRFWEHLQMAGIIEGGYTGVTNSGWVDSIPGMNVPASKISGACFGAARWTAQTGSGSMFPTTETNIFMIGAPATLPNGYCANPILLPEEMWNIDTKFDDGKPAYGKIVNQNPNAAPDCTTSTAADLAAYKLDTRVKGCAPVLKF